MNKDLWKKLTFWGFNGTKKKKQMLQTSNVGL